jgi:hypothetical protein
MGKSIEEIFDSQTATTSASTEPKLDTPQEPVEAAPVEVEPKETAPEANAPEPVVGKGEQSTGDKTDGPPPSGSNDDDDKDPRVKAFKAKALDEARKRQDYEKQVKERDDRLAAQEKRLQEQDEALRRFQAQQAQPQPQRQPQRPPQRQPLPDPDVDPGAAIRHVSSAFQATLQERDAQFREELWKHNVVTSQRYARGRYEDYDTVEEVFAEEMGRNPTLRAQLRQAEDPAEFAYQMGRKFVALREVGDDPVSWREKQLEALREQAAAEAAAKYEQQAAPAPPAKPSAPLAPQARSAPAPAPPKSLASVPSSAPRSPTRHAFNGPTPLEKLLG